PERDLPTGTIDGNDETLSNRRRPPPHLASTSRYSESHGARLSNECFGCTLQKIKPILRSSAVDSSVVGQGLLILRCARSRASGGTSCRNTRDTDRCTRAALSWRNPDYTTTWVCSRVHDHVLGKPWSSGTTLQACGGVGMA